MVDHARFSLAPWLRLVFFHDSKKPDVTEGPDIRYCLNEAEARMVVRLGVQMVRDKLLEAAMRRRDGEVFSITPRAENETLHVYDVMMSGMLDLLFAKLGDGSARRDRIRRVIESIF